MSDPVTSTHDADPILPATSDSHDADPILPATSDSHTTSVPNSSVRLRDRERLQATQLYGASLESTQIQQIDKVKRQRSGKKRSISLRITQINRILLEKGSRTKVVYLREKLQEAYDEILQVNKRLIS